MLNLPTRTSRPLHLHYAASLDLRPGEQALLQSQPFRTSHLRLLAGIRAFDLSYAGPDPAPRQQAHDSCMFDYLVCLESQILLAIHLSDNKARFGQFIPLKGLPVVTCDDQKFSQGHIQEIVDAITRQLDQPEGSPWRCFLQVLPRGMIGPLLRERMLERQDGKTVLPTEYGMCCGLVRTMWNGQSLTTCTPPTRKHLRTVIKNAGRLIPLPDFAPIPPA